jgi:hypothetical protein
MEEFVFSDLLKKAESAGGGFSALPAGEYEVTIESAEVRKTGTGKSKIAVRFKVTGGPHNGRAVFNDFVLSPGNDNAMVIFFRQMSALGLKSEYFSQNPSLEQVAKDLAGRRARLRLGVRTWQEVERNSVLGIMPAAGPQAGAFGSGASGPSFAPPPPLPRPAAVAEAPEEVAAQDLPASPPPPPGLPF